MHKRPLATLAVTLAVLIWPSSRHSTPVAL
jgi:hypothetical protein